jgi:selenide, water dikinase
LSNLFKPEDYPNLLVGLAKADDAAVYRINPTQAIITTTDFFPPVVDDAYDFGAIAAANAMSDVYAMGGHVLFAVNLVAFPEELDMEILGEILRGGAEKVAEAGGVIAGGHSVTDREPKYGLAVIGMVHPDQVKTKGGAQPGDVLFLTKPLGVGVVTTALKKEIADPAEVAAAVASMKALNRNAAEAAQKAAAHAMTDITGFGLVGHAHEMALASPVDFHFQADQLPWLPGARRLAEAGAFPGGTKRNRSFYGPIVRFSQQVDQVVQNLVLTPETSGGLLVAVSADNAGVFRQHCPTAVAVGYVSEGEGLIHFATS